MTPESDALPALATQLHGHGAVVNGLMKSCSRRCDEEIRQAARNDDEAIRLAYRRVYEAGLPCDVLSMAAMPTAHFTAELQGMGRVRAGVSTPFNRDMKNEEKGLPRHNFLILLLDQSTGKTDVAIEAGLVDAFRTATADAVATDLLARQLNPMSQVRYLLRVR